MKTGRIGKALSVIKIHQTLSGFSALCGILALGLVVYAVELRGEEYPYGIFPQSVTAEDAREAWESFKEEGLTSEGTPGPNMLRQSFPGIFDGDTAGEFQAWVLILAVMHDDHETAQRVWNYCKHFIPDQRAGLVPWRISGSGRIYPMNVGDACFDYAIALDVAARKWPDYRDDEGKSWADWAEYYINQIYEYYPAKRTNPESPNAISGKGYNPKMRAFHHGADEHYYLHYSPYGYLRNWQDRTGNRNWMERVGDLESVYEAEINLQRPTLAKYYGDATENPFSWPPHQVRKNGRPANDMIHRRYDSGWNMFNWGAGRITARANHAFTNYGDAHGAKMLRFLAERFYEETGGDPAKIRHGYRMGDMQTGEIRPNGPGSSGWGEPNIYHIGHAAMAAMVDEQYRDMLERMAQALKDFDTEGEPLPRLGQAYYLLHLTGGMDFRIEDR